jgi:hypothetical protein
MAEGLRNQFSVEERDFLFTITSRLFLGPTQPSVQWIMRISLGLMWKGRETDNSPPSNAQIKNGGTILPVPSMSVWHSTQLIKPRDNFTFSHGCHILYPSTSPNFDEEYKLISSLSCSYLHPHITSSLLDPYILITHSQNTIYTGPLMWETKSTLIHFICVSTIGFHYSITTISSHNWYIQMYDLNIGKSRHTGFWWEAIRIILKTWSFTVLRMKLNWTTPYCHVFGGVWLYMGSRLEIGINDHLYTSLGTTSYYNTIADFHTMSSQFVSLVVAR